MAENRDIIDDIIDIQQDWKAVSRPLARVTDSLVASATGAGDVFDPANYKERPRANSSRCHNVSFGQAGLCDRCVEVCPVDAIAIGKSSVTVADSCRKCGLCAAVCPADVFVVSKTSPRPLYDRIARIASAYERCYLTCTRAIGRLPEDNEVILPCVGALGDDLWFALLAEYDNIWVYLPVGICDRCRTTTGERTYVDAISRAEWRCGYPVGLEVDEERLDHEQSRAYKRMQFVGSAVRAGGTVAMPGLAGARAVAERIRQHTKRATQLQHTVERMVGTSTSQSKRRVLYQGRKLVLAALQEHPELAPRLKPEVPVCDRTLCTMCGDCAKGCTMHACDLDREGRFSVEPTYCNGCGDCAKACPTGALAMAPGDPDDLVILDPELEKRKAEAAAAKERGKKALKRGLDALESLAED